MNKKDKSFIPTEAFSIPEDTIFLDSESLYEPIKLAINGLKKTIKERNLDWHLKNKSEKNNLIIINGFTIQILFTGFTSDEIEIPLKYWFRKKGNPQILLAAKIDDENNVVYFQGILTAKEFTELVKNRINDENIINLPIEKFKGGINRLINFVEILEPNAIPEMGLIKNKKFNITLEKLSNRFKKLIPITSAAIVLILFGPEIFKPRLSANIASIPLQRIEIISRSRGAAPISACLISPTVFNKEDSSITVLLNFDKPLIFVKEALNEIQISQNKKLIWTKTASINKPIKGKIFWPLRPIKPGEQYILKLRPVGTSISQFLEIKIVTSSKEKFVNIDDLTNSLGDNVSRWTNIINEKFNNDKNLALRLLFSEKSPKSKIFNQRRSSIIDRNICE